jgi:hypothetical protein
MPATKHYRECVSVEISHRILVNVTRYQEQTWFHIKQVRNGRSISLTADEITSLINKKEKWQSAAQEVFLATTQENDSNTDGNTSCEENEDVFKIEEPKPAVDKKKRAGKKLEEVNKKKLK